MTVPKHADSSSAVPALVGCPVRRKEDLRFIIGQGRYVDDISVPGLVHAAIVRSCHAHARILSIDHEAVHRLPGVVAVFTAVDLPECEAAVPPLFPSPEFRPYHHSALVREEVRYVGEPIAVVIADDPYHAADAVAAVKVEYEVMPASITVADGLAPDAPRVFEEWPDNIVGLGANAVGDVTRALAAADVVLEARLSFPRVAPMPIEPRAILVHPAPPDGILTVWTTTQVPYVIRAAIAAALGLSQEQVRVLAPDVGGAFGGKGHTYPEDIIVPAAARKLRRPVKWVETRHEHFLAVSPDRDQRHTARIGVKRDGSILAIETSFTRDHGAYPTLGNVISLNTINHLCGPYRVPNFRGDVTNVVTHKTFSAAYRGAGRPEAAFILDRLLDRAARAIEMDPAEFRRRNMIRADQMPYRPGFVYRDGFPVNYDPADYVAGFDRALAMLDYEYWRCEQKRKRHSLCPVGVGLSAYVEGTGIGPFEGAEIRIDPDGTVYLFVGVASQGQAHETTLAQVCAAELAVPVDQVVVVGGDTAVFDIGMGTIGSRVAVNAGPAAARAAREVARKIRLVAGELLECAAADVLISGGRAHVVGVPDRWIAFGQLARDAIRSAALAREGRPGLNGCAFFYPETVTWAFGAHACAVEVDVETGEIRLLKYVAVHDCGRAINPTVVEGQLHGGIVQGIGTALTEELVHDANGQLLTGTLMDYGVPVASRIPSLEVAALNYPSPMNELGIKGVGESGIIAPSGAIANAVEDALATRGVTISSIPLLPFRVWSALEAAAAAR